MATLEPSTDHARKTSSARVMRSSHVDSPWLPVGSAEINPAPCGLQDFLTIPTKFDDYPTDTINLLEDMIVACLRSPGATAAQMASALATTLAEVGRRCCDNHIADCASLAVEHIGQLFKQLLNLENEECGRYDEPYDDTAADAHRALAFDALARLKGRTAEAKHIKTDPADSETTRSEPLGFPQFLPERTYTTNSRLNEVPQFWAMTSFHFAAKAEGVNGYEDECQLGSELAAHYIQFARDTIDENQNSLLRCELLPLVTSSLDGVKLGFLDTIERLLIEKVPEPFDAVRACIEADQRQLAEDEGEPMPAGSTDPTELVQSSTWAEMSSDPRENLSRAREALGYLPRDYGCSHQQRAVNFINCAVAQLEKKPEDRSGEANQYSGCHWSELIRTDIHSAGFPDDVLHSLLFAALDTMKLLHAAEREGLTKTTARFGGVNTAYYFAEAALKIVRDASADNVAAACKAAHDSCQGLLSIINEDIENDFPSTVSLPAIQHAIDLLHAAIKMVERFDQVDEAA